jgi:hypothetical protein
LERRYGFTRYLSKLASIPESSGKISTGSTFDVRFIALERPLSGERTVAEGSKVAAYSASLRRID